ncbi:MAG TPA: hypothetical protein VL200_10345 [Lacunisphaera sp.]|jgi:hypothetical protein|nr:hypothetical protein [Lacunisphaera sp.]
MNLADNGGPDEATAPPASPRRRWRWPRWVAGAAALLLMPKCLVCLAGYAALAAGFGFAGAEICGAGGPNGLTEVGARLGLSPRQAAWVLLGVTAVAAVALTLAVRRILRRNDAGLSEKSGLVR